MARLPEEYCIMGGDESENFHATNTLKVCLYSSQKQSIDSTVGVAEFTPSFYRQGSVGRAFFIYTKSRLEFSAVHVLA